MQIQKSFESESDPALYIVPTPIGNLDDMTIRALNVLKEVPIIAAEDTRNTRKLLNHFDIHTRLISYHEHSKESRAEQLLSELRNGHSIALVSDAGMPMISDPGHKLLQKVMEEDFRVVVLPGANAALCALIGSGLDTDEFYFYGFLPRKKREKESELVRLKKIKGTLIFYESPYRLKDTMQVMLETLGNRKVTIARELTKKFETYIRTTIEQADVWLKENEVKGECCIIVEGETVEDQETDTLWWSHLSIIDHVDLHQKESELTKKDAIKRVAQERKMPKREVYQLYHEK